MAATTQVRLLVWTFLCKMRVCNMCPHAPKTCHSAGLAVCSTSSCARAEAATVAAVSMPMCRALLVMGKMAEALPQAGLGCSTPRA